MAGDNPSASPPPASCSSNTDYYSTTTTTPPPPSVCRACGGPISYPSSSPPPWSDTFPPPAYCLIRAPAINAPTNTAAIILSPVPQPLPVPPATPPFHFEIPSKRISCPDDISRFHFSSTSRHFVGFVAALSHSVRGSKLSDPVPSPLPSTLSALLSILQTLSHWVDEIPPAPHAARYGNPAFRSWHTRLSDEGRDLVLTLLPSHELRPAADELVPHLLYSFGNASSIDHGTGP